MGLVLVFFLISLIVGGIVFCANNTCDTKDRLKFTIIGICASIVIFGTIGTGFIVGDSYNSYLDNRAFYDATIEQYRGAVEMYKDYAVIDMNKTRSAFTDFKYQGYQKEISSMILDLRRKIVSYNRSFMLKKIKNASWFFNWYIIANDPNMKIIRMIEKEELTAKKTGFVFLDPSTPQYQ